MQWKHLQADTDTRTTPQWQLPSPAMNHLFGFYTDPSPFDAELFVAHLLNRNHDLLLDALLQLEVELISVLRHWTEETRETRRVVI